MSDIPFDSTIPFLREGYPFISSRCDRAGTDMLTTRIALRPVTFLRGAEAASVFYDGRRFTRQGAMPHAIQHLLQDEGSVQSLDGASHRRRKHAFLSLMAPSAMTRLGDLFEEEWHRAAERLHGRNGWSSARSPASSSFAPRCAGPVSHCRAPMCRASPRS